MATKLAAPTSSFAFGDEEESRLANQRYQDAYDKLTQAVEARSEKPWFDPTLLAAAQGFLAPTRTGNFFESIGNAAGTLGKAQEAEQTKSEELARMRLELAGMGVERARQQWIAKGYKDLGPVAGTQPGTQPATQPGAISAQAAAKGEKTEEPEISTSPTFKIGVASPVDEASIIQQYRAAGKPISEARLEIAEQKRKRIIEKEGFIFNQNTGEITIIPTGTLAEVNIPDKGLVKVPVGVKQALESLEFTDPQAYWKLVDRVVKGPARVEIGKIQKPEFQARPYSIEAQEAAAPTAPPAATPTAAPSAAPSPQPPVAAAPPVVAKPTVPSGRLSVQQEEEQKAELASQRAIAQARETEQAKADIAATEKAKEENRKDERETLVEIKKAGRNQVNIADQYAKLVTEFPNAIGTAAKPGFLSAGIKLLESGASIGGESAKASALQDAVQTLRGTPEELSARRVIMGLAAEYLFNLRSLAKGQGTITDYETRVLSSIGPSIEDDPKTARFKAAIIKMHGEAEIARANEYNEWKKRHQGMGWKDYLGSKDHDKFAAQYDQDLARAYDIYLGKKPQKPAAQPASNPALDFARSLKGKP
jgi:hypothetical protein